MRRQWLICYTQSPIMKSFIFRSALAIGLAVLLAACGAGNTVDQPVQTAGVVGTADSAAQPIVTVATATMPAPDCAVDGCRGLRIIDANAEAFRFDAARRAAEGNTAS